MRSMASLNKLLACTSCVLALLVLHVAEAASNKKKTFRAAVFEYEAVFPPNTKEPVSREEALRHMQVNLDVFKTTAVEAKKQGADILVYPEDAIYGGELSRVTIDPYLEVIPDPEKITWSPCADPDRFENTEILRFLSCLAMNNSLYVVVNYGDKVPCSPRYDPDCPPDHRYHYNTGLAYGPDGTLLTKYHKRNLFPSEGQFDIPEPQVRYFDTPFGRFGIVICFDLVLKDPTLSLLVEHGVKNIAFTTAWVNVLPLMSSVGLMSSVARGFGINVLAGCLRKPEIKSFGTGLYGHNGTKAFYFDQVTKLGNRLVVGDLDVLDDTTETGSEVSSNKKAGTEIDHIKEVNYHVTDELKKQNTFKLESQNRTFFELDGKSQYAKACIDDVCCYLTYEKGSSSADDLFALAAINEYFLFNISLQTCSVMRCSKLDRDSCGAHTYQSSTAFRKLKLTAEVNTPYILPQVILSNGGNLEVTKPEQWSFTNKRTIEFKEDSVDTPLLAATLMGRNYDTDGCSVRCGNENEMLAMLGAIFDVRLDEWSHGEEL